MPTIVDMIAAVLGTGAIIKAVERTISIEFDLCSETVTAETNSRAREGNIQQYFRGHRPQMPPLQCCFHDYDGCDALRCSKEECRAAFCAIFLAGCGTDAHQYVLVPAMVPNLFDKKSYNISEI